MNCYKGHILALFTIFVWGSTFSSTKILLEDFNAIEILFIRFFIAYIVLFVLHYKSLGFLGRNLEFLFFLAGLCGACFYFLLENIALGYTSASNASLLVAIIPLFTVFLGFILYRKPITKLFLFGTMLAFVGVAFVVLRGEWHFSFIGDVLCILAGLMWSFYTLIIDKVFLRCKSESSLAITKKIFFYGLVCIFPLWLWQSTIQYNALGIDSFLQRFTNPYNLLNLAFLGCVASAICYLTWNTALNILGALKASVYLYAVPVIGVFVATISLGETVTLSMIVGGFLVLFGLFISQRA